MDIENSTMRERQRKFRRVYRDRVAGWYNGWIHVALIYTIGLAAIAIYVSNISSVHPLEFLIVPIVFMVCNMFEWLLHAQVMHRPRNFFGLRAIYERHTLTHHQFFTDREMRFADHRDWRVTFFPPYALVLFILMSIIPSYILGKVFSPNVGWLTMSTTTGMYLVYEFMHFTCHIDERPILRHIPFVNTIRRHHTAHHDQHIMMERNMNLTFPISDWLFGTSDLNRGLFGHLFNGYSGRYVRKDMRVTSSNPVSAARGLAADGPDARMGR